MTAPRDLSAEPTRPPTPLSRRERERILRESTAGPDATPPSRRPLLLLVAAVAVVGIGAMFGIAALSGSAGIEDASPEPEPNVTTTLTDAGASSTTGTASTGGTSSSADVASGEEAATASPTSPSTATTSPTTVTVTEPPTTFGPPLQADLTGGQLRVEGQVSSSADAEVVIGVLQALAGGAVVASELTIDPAAAPAGLSLVVGGRTPFAVGSSTIETSFVPVLDRMAALMIEDPEVSIVVEGHADGTGDAVRNLALSQARAEAVVDYIAEQGVNRFRLEPRGRGSTDPVAEDDTAEGQSANRRLEFVLLGLAIGPGG